MNSDGSENCEIRTELEGQVGNSVKFDARVEYRHGGACGVTQNVRIMSLNKMEENGGSTSQFICSNLGRLRNVHTCANRSRVSVSSGGASKYDVSLHLNDLTLADAGTYYIKVDVDESVGGRRVTIRKNFVLTVDVAGAYMVQINA